ncbi:hypothetical protein GUJ93_ZPchr0013g35760 [Zizania palustris]|uniref:Uncharacterized protein n=1 Tax=Zizania palustris TaxID=103762 RepID=A0A8J5X4D7_ZIZPA|nr:hypothetical protein GUJ93_ZPchr0013g35760 [Zizania palustris]
MGSVPSALGAAVNSFGTLIGKVVSAPFRRFFDASCEGVCSGIWDVACFIENMCIGSFVASLGRLLMLLILSYISVVFVYLVCKVGIIQCVVKSVCKVAMAACCSYCHALGGTTCFLWRKLRDTKRVRRRRRRRDDVEDGARGVSGSSSSSDDEEEEEQTYRGSSTSSVRGSSAKAGSSSARERRKDRLRQSLRLRRLSSKEKTTARRGSHGESSSGRYRLRVGAASKRIKVSSLPARRAHEARQRARSLRR